MRILQVGWGFIPFRGGGLIEYAEDLMEIQVENGDEVFYFCTGRTNLSLKPVLKQWKDKRGFEIFELQNPPVISGLDLGTTTPLLDISEPLTEAVFLDVVKKVRPQIIHFQELTGLPSSIIDRVKSMNIKTVFTVHDYYTLCPTLKLVKSDYTPCRITGTELAIECAKCCIDAPANNTNYKVNHAIHYFLQDKPYKAPVSAVMEFARKFRRLFVPKAEENAVNTNNASPDYYQRRVENLKNLPKFDQLIAVSHKVAQVLSYYIELDNIVVVHGRLKHIELMTAKRIQIKRPGKIRFGLINVFSNILKGKTLVIELFEKILAGNYADKVEFIVFGWLSDKNKKQLKKYPFVKLQGLYKADNLDRILDESELHVGIVPSVWEEAYGFVGVEFIAKGIPVIGNNIGGIPEYVLEGETGWLNKSCTSTEMFRIIENLIKNPGQIEAVNGNIISNRKKYIGDMNSNYEMVRRIYKGLLAKDKQTSIEKDSN
jgi:glycosyltransferase involved in cell wall biosynthesis